MSAILTDLNTWVFAKRLTTSGENVTFRRLNMLAIVQRLGGGLDSSGNVNVATKKQSKIEVPISVARPDEGEVFTDAAGDNHRLIRRSTFAGHCWQCDCETT